MLVRPSSSFFFLSGVSFAEKMVRIFVLNVLPLSQFCSCASSYHQTKKLAGGLAEKFEISVVDCLARVKNTKTQIGLT